MVRRAAGRGGSEDDVAIEAHPAEGLVVRVRAGLPQRKAEVVALSQPFGAVPLSLGIDSQNEVVLHQVNDRYRRLAAETPDDAQRIGRGRAEAIGLMQEDERRLDQAAFKRL